MPRPLLALLIAPVLAAADAAAEPAPPAPDPTAAVVAEGRWLYRQRDLDALLQIATRHARQRLTREDEDALRLALTRALVAREPLIEALGRLPVALDTRARDQLVLDLLDYQAEPAPTRPLTPTEVAGEVAAAPSAPAGDAAPATPAAEGPMLVRLPPLTIQRPVEGGRRTVTLGLALYFADAALSRTLEARAPLVQDAILGHLHQLPTPELVEPNQIALKEGLVKAVQAKVPEFPADGILIPQLEVGAVEK